MAARRQNCNRVLAVLAADQSVLGMLHNEVRDMVGLPSVQCSAALLLLVRSARAFHIQSGHDTRYFATAERREAARPAFAEHMAQLLVIRKRSVMDRRNAALRAKCAAKRALMPPKVKAEKPPKPPKAAKPKPTKQDNRCQPAPVSVKVQKSPKWSDMPAIRPPGVKVQRVSGCPARTRYEPEPHFVGELSREWKALRGKSTQRTNP